METYVSETSIILAGFVQISNPEYWASTRTVTTIRLKKLPQIGFLKLATEQKKQHFHWFQLLPRTTLEKKYPLLGFPTHSRALWDFSKVELVGKVYYCKSTSQCEITVGLLVVKRQCSSNWHICHIARRLEFLLYHVCLFVPASAGIHAHVYGSAGGTVYRPVYVCLQGWLLIQ